MITAFVRPFRLFGVSSTMTARRIPASIRPISPVSPVSTPILAKQYARGAKPLLKDLHGAREMAQEIRHLLPPRAVELLDAGALTDLRCEPSGRLDAPILRTIVESTEPGEVRHETVTAFNVLLRHILVRRKNCGKCLYPKHRCLCDRIRYHPKPKHTNLWVFQHFAEYGRSNNSGSLLCLIADARRCIRGLLAEQDTMVEDIMHHHRNDSTCVLFPTADAIPADEYIAQRRKRFSNNGRSEPPLTVIVLDGTGRQARSLQRFIPEEIPRICLPTATCESWLNPMRLQTEAHRVCSAQAAAAVLDLAGDSEVADNIEDAVRVLVADAERDRAIHSLPEKVLNL